MPLRVAKSPTRPGAKTVRWYVWYGVPPRKERLSVLVARLQGQGHHGQAADIIAKAVRKGYRV